MREGKCLIYLHLNVSVWPNTKDSLQSYWEKDCMLKSDDVSITSQNSDSCTDTIALQLIGITLPSATKHSNKTVI